MAEVVEEAKEAKPKKERKPRKPPAPRVKLRVQRVKIDSIRPHPDNPRRGSLPAIRQSLQANGQYRPLIVQQSTGLIIGGNHTWKAAKDLGWGDIEVVYLDVDDQGAKRIMLSDNRTNDLASYDTEALAAVLSSIDQPSIGTGYDDADVKAIIAAIEASEPDVAALTAAVRPTVELVKGAPAEYESDEDDYDQGQAPVIADDASTFDGPKDDVDEGDKFEDSLGVLQGALTLKEDMIIRGDNYYGIPELRRDMLVDTLPEPLDTWGGKDATPDDGVTHWLWNYGVAAASGLPADRTILCFYTYDERFENWWDNPGYMTAKAINMGITQAVVPDFSLYSDMPVALHVYNVFRAQWMGRFFQEAGMKVIPRLQFHNERSLDFCLLGIPKGPPVLMHSAQNLKSNGPGKRLTDMERLAADTINKALAILQPEVFVVYGGPPAHRLVDSGAIKDTNVERIVKLKNYVWQRRGVVYDKKDGIGSKAKVQKLKKAAKGEQPVEDTMSAEEQELEAWGI